MGRIVFQVALALALAGLAWRALRRGELEGTWLGVPYDLRPPTLDRLRQRFWNRDDPRLLTPHLFGWGYSINVYELGRRLGLIPAS